MGRLVALVPILLCLIACSPDAHDHGHDAGEDPRPGHAVTVYEGGLELFMEYPSLVIGQPSPLVAHFTDARDPEAFAWVTTGEVTATLRYPDGWEERFVADKLLRNGIFKPIVTPTRAGPATLSLALEGAPAAGVVHVGDVVVAPSVEAAIAAAPEETSAEATVSYLKEAQWKTVYATEAAVRRPLRGSVRATGELRAPSGASADLAAPFAGRVVARAALAPGRPVRKGEVLVELVPLDGDRSALDAQKARADAELALAEQAAARADALYPGVLSAGEHQRAQAEVAAARAEVGSLSSRMSAWRGSGGSGVELRSPVDGAVAFSAAEPGRVVQAGERLVSVVDGSMLWLVADVFEGDAARVIDAPGAMFTVSGSETPYTVYDGQGAARVGVGAAVDPLTRTVPVVFAFPNPGGLLPGMFAKVRVFTAETRDGVVVPAASIVDDAGFPTVFVMDGGESFFKRRVTLGVREGDHVQVLAGVAEGERVVSRGAWEVKLSTTAGGIPEHGHTH